MEWKANNEKQRGYDFTYDNLSRLKEAFYLEGGVRKSNFNTSYTYDKHGNILTLTRHGNTSRTGYGVMDNLTLNYKGNQLIKADDSAPDPTLFSMDFRDVKGSSIEYTYDANGNLTKDLNKGITQIRYNLLNLPSQVNFNHTGQPVNEYTYAVDGSKLQVNHKKSSGGKVTDYVGNMIYEEGSLKRILVDGGFYEEGKYYFYLKDHLGNNRVVADASGSAIQVTHYYPFGMSFTEGFEQDIKPAKQPYKYNGKELDGENSLNWYDYEARQLAMDVPRFTSIDPLAEKYYSISPYVYVLNNPLKYIDPNGLDTLLINRESGRIEDHIRIQEGNDIVYLVDADGNRHESLTLSKRAIKRTKTQTTAYEDDKGNTQVGSIDIIEINGDQNGENFFKFLANHFTPSKGNNAVEFSHIKTGIEGIGPNFITTTGLPDREKGGGRLFDKQLYHYFLRSFGHNHPGNTTEPSGIGDNRVTGEKAGTWGDVGFKNHVTNYINTAYHPKRVLPVFYIYIPKSGAKIPY